MFTGIQKLHIRTVPLAEQPRRITQQPETKTLGVMTITAPAAASGTAVAGSGLL